MPRSTAWSDVERLLGDQKYRDAGALLDERLAAAHAVRNEPEWTGALVHLTRLRLALHGHETAARFLRDAPRPPGILARTILGLLYGRVLLQYLRANAWEIAQRPRVEARGEVDLRTATADQLFAEALGTYAAVWRDRAELSHEPVTALDEYLAPNTYPTHVRGTLRDAVTYLAVELLADAADRLPHDDAATARLDVAALVTDDAGAPPPRLDDAARHPLARIAAALGDLERWHVASERREAALEARLERLRRLHAALPARADRAQLRASLEARLAADRALPWWAAGRATLAGFVRAAGDLSRAHALAREGALAYPGTPGEQLCVAAQRVIEAPDYRLTAMGTDAPGRRSLRVEHKNLAALYFRAFAVDLLKRLETAQDYALLPAFPEWDKALRASRKRLFRTAPAAEWRVDLPDPQDYRAHVTYVTPPLAAPGLYIVVASARKDFAEENNRLLATNLVLSDLVLLSRSEPSGDVAVTVLHGATGEPAAGAEVSLYRYDFRTREGPPEAQATDAHGETVFAAEGRQGTSYFLVARRGEHVALDTTYVGFYSRATPDAAPDALVYTDRAVYRPLQTLRFKVLAYGPPDSSGLLAVEPGVALTLALQDANDQPVAEASVTTNAHGSASGEFVLPAGRLLGRWQLVTSRGAKAVVRVEEYKRPGFDVALDDPAEALRLGRAATLAGTARYYFGQPVTRGTVHWRITRYASYPWWWRHVHAGEARHAAETHVASGAAQLADDGCFALAFTPAADPRDGAADGVVYSFHVAVELADEGGETRRTARAFRVGTAAVTAAITAPGDFVREGAEATLAIARTTLDGAPLAGAGTYRLYRVVQPAEALLPADVPLVGGAAATPGDALRPRWDTRIAPEALFNRWPDGDEIARGEVTHDATGAADVRLPALPAGVFRLRYETADAFGAPYATWHNVVVAGAQPQLRLPVFLGAERHTVEVGETARLLVASGLADQWLLVDVTRDGARLQRHRLRADAAGVLEIPVTAEHRGGFTATLAAVRDHQHLTATCHVDVPWRDRALTVTVAPARDRLRPGGHEALRLTVRDPDGAPVGAGEAEVLAYMYDRSLDAVAPHAPPSVLDLYPTRGAAAPLRASLEEQPVGMMYRDLLASPPPRAGLAGDRLRFLDGIRAGGPGAHEPSDEGPDADADAAPDATESEIFATPGYASDALAKDAGDTAAPTLEPELRADFAETAFFRAHVVTDAAGGATIEFDVPDTVTAWRVWAHAITRDVRGGAGQRAAQSLKDIMVRPYLPRFLREGDAAELRVVVHNTTDTAHAADVALTLEDALTRASLLTEFGITDNSRAVQVPAGGTAAVTFALTVPPHFASVAVTASARAGDASDGERHVLPVLPSRAHLAVSRTAALQGPARRTLARPGTAPARTDESLVVNVDATLFDAVLAALPYLARPQSACTEQALNRFVSAAVVARALHDTPALAARARALAARTTALAPWAAAAADTRDHEDTPWWHAAHGGTDHGAALLDPDVARAQRDAALAALRSAQAPSGAFPWFPGGPPSPHVTLYILHGLARATAAGGDVPHDMVTRAWSYLAGHLRDDVAARMRAGDASAPELAFLNYVATAYPDDAWPGVALGGAERADVLAYTFARWRALAPYPKACLALTLHRAGRHADARQVFASVMDAAQTAPDLGTYWAPDARAWLWYHDTVEGHAFALRALLEIAPDDPRRDGLVLWLLLNKKLNQWKSTRATAEAIDALVQHVRRGRDADTEADQDVTVTAGDAHARFTLAPAGDTGRAQWAVPGAHAAVVVETTTPGVLFASATWQYATERAAATDAAGGLLAVQRAYFRREYVHGAPVLRPLADGAALAVGDEVEVQLTVRAAHAAEYVRLRDPRAAGLEPERATSRYQWDLGLSWYEEARESGTHFFFEQLPAGEFTLRHRLRASTAGTFRVGPATLQSLYAPEFVAHSNGHALAIAPARAR